MSVFTMSDKADYPLTPDFAFCLTKHFKDERIQVQEEYSSYGNDRHEIVDKLHSAIVKINVLEICDQDIYFLSSLRRETEGKISVSIRRSGKGMAIIIGLSQLKVMPQWLINYVRIEHETAF